MGDSNITRIEPLGAPLDGAARVPGDKSISHRAVLLPLWQKEPRV